MNKVPDQQQVQPHAPSLPDEPIPPQEAELLADELKALGIQQNNARAWITTIATITGVSAVLGFTVKADDLSNLDSLPKAVTVIAGLASVVLVAFAIFFAGRVASGGVPELAVATAGGRRAEIKRMSGSAAHDMKTSYGLTILGVIVAAIGIGAAALGQQVGLGDKRWILTETSSPPLASQAYCGQLAVESTNGNLMLYPLDEDNGQQGATSFPPRPVSQFTSLTETSMCP